MKKLNSRKKEDKCLRYQYIKGIIMKKVFNIIVIITVLAITYLTVIVLNAYFSNSIGISISYDLSAVVVPMVILLGSLLYNFLNKSLIMILISSIGLIEISILGFIILKL